MAIIYRDFAPRKDHINSFGPALFTFSKDLFYSRQKYIHQVFELQVPRAYAEMADSGARVQIEIRHPGKLPMRIAEVKLDGRPLRLPDTPLYAFPMIPGQSPEPQAFSFPAAATPPLDPGGPHLVQVTLELPGTGVRREIEAMPRPFPKVGDLEKAVLQRQPNHDRFSWLSLDEDRALILARAGAWVLREDLILPAGYKLQIEPGFSLDLVGGAKIISYASLRLLANPEAPIVFYSSDQTGQGLAVLNAAARSELEHVRFEGLSNPSEDGWELTGAVSFYQSPVNMREVSFLGNRCEDALNLVRSPFLLEQVRFVDTRYDALDADFSDGRILQSSFADCGNDAVDVSGGQVHIMDTSMTGIGDKGVSAGENSRVIAHRLTIEDALVGLASKDLSHLEIDHCRILRADIDLAVYQKKPEFGPASILVGQLTWSGDKLNALIEEGSLLRIGGADIEANCQQALKQIEQLALYRRYRQKAKVNRL